VTATFSIVLPTYESPLDHLVDALRSIQAQRYPQWTCEVVDDGSADHRVTATVRSFAARDPRFRLTVRRANGGIAAATNTGIERADGEWIVFADHDDLLDPEALDAIARHAVRHPRDEFVYTDEQMIDSTGNVIAEYRKPDLSPERLIGQNYVNHLVAMRRTLLERIGPLDARFEPAQDRDLVLRAAGAASSVGHIARVLYSWRAVMGSIAVSPDQKLGVGRAVADAARVELTRRGEVADVCNVPDSPTCLHIHRPVPDDVPVVRVPIDRRTTPADVNQALDDRSDGMAVLVPSEAADAGDEWITPLLAQCARPAVGAAGPRLVTSDGRLVSAGRVHHPALRDVLQGAPATEHGPWGAFLVARECASVAPLGSMVRLDHFHELGGLDEEVGLDAALAEFCVMLRLTGRSTIWSPLSTLVVDPDHLDSADRLTARDDDVARITERLAEIGHDPYSPFGVFPR
jgi:O-antigen biosynthesis protein